ncbi:ABC transporter permease [Cardinium endosymbiont of Nabis limbatus]|uniref:ABC transporter permease n=1 Tax=Cardinium endosymbiont of Nabis limbatus TaxID=3066217 RepID=UPI003AF40303
MFVYQWFLEVFDGLSSHKVKTIFRGFGVMWAMFILVLLQGAGAGLYNGMVKKFYSHSNRAFSIHSGYHPTGTIHLTEALTDDLASNLTVFEQVMPLFRINRSVTYPKLLPKTGILGVRAGYEKIKHLTLAEGRFFSERDMAQRSPVCILGLKIKTALFDTKAAVGTYITVDGTAFYVVGVLEATAGVDDDKIVIPSSLFSALFPHSVQTIDCIMCSLAPKQNPLKAEEKVRTHLARRLNFDAQDKQLLYIHNISKRASSFQLLFVVMQSFIWFVSFCFLVSGVVSVGNMMLVVVKDRTQELAIRRVLGAKSSDIISLILVESIVINLISGILGLGIGIGILQSINAYLGPVMQKHGMAYFEFEFSMVVSALVVLVLSGCLAGIIPAKRALYIKPVDALNNE